MDTDIGPRIIDLRIIAVKKTLETCAGTSNIDQWQLPC